MIVSQQKTNQWQRIEREVAQITDALECPIDPRIFETIVAFHALHIHTIGSCEGHLDHGVGAPYVDIEALHIEEEESRGMRMLYAAEEQEDTELSFEEIDRQRSAAKAILREVARKRLEARARVDGYLERFYQLRQVSFDRRLVIQNIILQGLYTGPARLESQGTALQTIRDEEERQQRLEAYQDEMKAFTRFLKEIFFVSIDA